MATQGYAGPLLLMSAADHHWLTTDHQRLITTGSPLIAHYAHQWGPLITGTCSWDDVERRMQ